MLSAGCHDRVDQRTPMAGIGFADEEPVLLADGSWPDGILNQVIVDLQQTVAQVRQERRPLVESVRNRPPHDTLGEKASLCTPVQQDALEPFDDRPALQGSGDCSQLGTCSGLPQLLLSSVKALDQMQNQTGLFRRVSRGIEEAAPQMCPAADEFDLIRP